MHTQHRTLRRLLLPLTAAGAGVYLLIGCIPLPGDFQREGGGVRPERRIGKPDSDRPIQLGRSTRQNVYDVLGMPGRATPDGRAIAYAYTVRTGAILWPLCFHADSIGDGRVLVIRFGDTDLIESFKVYKRLEDSPEGARQTFRPGFVSRPAEQPRQAPPAK